jgi:hypothetical protein
LKRFLVDSGFILALYKNEGEQTTRVRETFERVISSSESLLVLPWPIMYERLNSEFVRNKGWIKRFNVDWSNLQRARKFEYADDAPFREACKKELLGLSPERIGRFKGLSLVDRILMDLIDDRSRNIEALLTLDLKDFSGFCSKKQIEILPGV